MPVRPGVLSLPMPLRVLLAAQPELVTPGLQVVQRVVTSDRLDSAQPDADEDHGRAVTLIQRSGSRADMNIHPHDQALDGVYGRNADGAPGFIEASAPNGHEPQALLQTVIARLVKRLTLRGATPRDAPARQPLCADIDGFSLRAAVVQARPHPDSRRPIANRTVIGSDAGTSGMPGCPGYSQPVRAGSGLAAWRGPARST